MRRNLGFPTQTLRCHSHRGNLEFIKAQPVNDQKALVTGFEDVDMAKSVIVKLHDGRINLEKIELVTKNVNIEAPEVETPIVHATTESSMIKSAAKWGSIGAGTGLFAGLFTPFPGLALGIAAMGALTGGILGGVAGVYHAVGDNSVNLPTLEEYEQMLKNGHCLVVVRGNHVFVMQAEKIVKSFPDIHRHVHALNGHEHHEHPAHEIP